MHGPKRSGTEVALEHTGVELAGIAAVETQSDGVFAVELRLVRSELEPAAMHSVCGPAIPDPDDKLEAEYDS